MIDQTTRSAILRLRSEGHGTRAIATALGISRGAVKRVLAAGSDQVPHLERAELAEPHRDDILSLYASCKGNLVRVHEERRLVPPPAKALGEVGRPQAPRGARTDGWGHHLPPIPIFA